MTAGCAIAAFSVTIAHASCAGYPPTIASQLAAEPVVFVGTVLYTSDADRSARVKVDSIWKGPVLAAFVDVHGEAPGSGPWSASEADHRYQAGARYLFGPLNSASPFEDYGECGTLTQPYTAALAAFQPRNARRPAPATTLELVQNVAGQRRWPYVALLAALALAAVVAVAHARRRQRS